LLDESEFQNGLEVYSLIKMSVHEEKQLTGKQKYIRNSIPDGVNASIK
jgi:hypothetical protein